MSNNKGPVTQQQVRININLDTLETVACPSCKNPVFETNHSILKKLPVIQSPTGRAQLIRVDLVCCPDCGSFYRIKDDILYPVDPEKY